MDLVVVSLFLAYHASRMRLLYPKRGQGRVPNLKQGAWASILQGPSSKLSSILYVFFLQIFLSNVKCTGDEHSLLECENDGFGVTGDCTHKNDAGVRCLKEGKPLYQKLINITSYLVLPILPKFPDI